MNADGLILRCCRTGGEGQVPAAALTATTEGVAELHFVSKFPPGPVNLIVLC